MAGRRTNLALLGALTVALVTGWLAFSAGTGWGRAVVVAHGVAGLSVVLLSPWKSVIARRGLRKDRKGRTASLLLAVLVAGSLAMGIFHALGGRRLAGLSAMQWHAGLALAALPVALLHLRRRPVPPRRADLSRRNLLRGAGVLAGGGLLYAGLEGLSSMLGLAGSRRRFTGSHERGSFDPAAMPVTQWLNDRVPEVDARGWRLEVATASGTGGWDLGALASLPAATVDAVLDCTGGWYAQQRWKGVPLRELVGDAPGRSIAVTSLTGYSRRFPMRDLDRLWLATGVAGAPLSAGHGFPARLVAPGRRGFWWVKWVSRVEVDDRPWWLQLPFPAE